MTRTGVFTLRCSRCGTPFEPAEVGTTDLRFCYACDPDEDPAGVDKVLMERLLARRAAEEK